jgi:hypothetical protein
MGNQQGKDAPEGPTLGGKKKSFFQDVGDALEKTGEGVKDAFDFTGGAVTSCGSEDMRGRGMSGSTRALLAAYESDPEFRAKAKRMTARHSSLVSADQEDGGAAASSSSSSSSSPSSTRKKAVKRELSAKGRSLLVGFSVPEGGNGSQRNAPPLLLPGKKEKKEKRGSMITGGMGGMGGGGGRRRASRRPVYDGDPAALFDACRKVSDVTTDVSSLEVNDATAACRKVSDSTYQIGECHGMMRLIV